MNPGPTPSRGPIAAAVVAAIQAQEGDAWRWWLPLDLRIAVSWIDEPWLAAHFRDWRVSQRWVWLRNWREGGRQMCRTPSERLRFVRGVAPITPDTFVPLRQGRAVAFRYSDWVAERT